MSLASQITFYRFLHRYGEGLLADIDAEQAVIPVVEGGHHPAWIIGHLGLIGSRGVAMLGGEPAVDHDAWEPLFGIGSQPSADASHYPAWDELLGGWRDAHVAADRLAETVSEARLDEPNPIERRRDVLPTVRDMAGFVFASHEALHLGQLSAWRRVHGRPPLF
ncbi:MAG: DinB family protein [Planctomycetota bacterium]